MQICLIVDVETTGLDPKTDAVIEIGVVLYSITYRTTIAQFSRLLYAPSNPCESINRIPAVALSVSDAVEPARVIESWVARADVIVAHNADFDRQWFPDLGKPWLCTMSDFKWPHATKDGGSLIHLALDHGIGVSSAHRALTDCQLIAALFDRMDDLPGMFAQAMRPKAVFRALVSYDDREQAKAAGFKWDGVTKQWTRRMAIEDAALLPFPTAKLADA